MISQQMQQDILMRLYKNHDQQQNSKKNKNEENKLSKYLPKPHIKSILNPIFLQNSNINIDVPLTTYDELHRSLSLQKQNLNRKTNIFYETYEQNQNKIMDMNKEINMIYNQLGNKHDIDWIKNISCKKFDLKQINYHMKNKIGFKQYQYQQEQNKWNIKTNIILQEIQKLEKQCANIFTLQNQKIQKLQTQLFDQINNIVKDKKININNQIQPNYNYNHSTERIKGIVDQAKQNLQDKIQSCRKLLNKKFDKKILSIIQKVQNNLNIHQK